MKLTVVGGGNWDIYPNRHAPAFLVEHEGCRILLDCGYGTLARLVEMGIAVASLSAVCVTHFHSDHFLDALPIVKSRQIQDGRRLGPIEPLYLVGPHGLREHLEALAKCCCHQNALTTKQLKEVKWTHDGWQKPVFEIGPFAIAPFPVNHVLTEMCLGYVVSTIKSGSPAKKIIYAGDLSGPLDEQVWLREHCQKGCDLLIIEGGSSPPKHPMVCDTMAFVADYGGRVNLINHIPVEYLESARQQVSSDPRVSIAQDDMVFEL